jgi:hypothetical protein
VVGQVLPEGSKKPTALILRGMSNTEDEGSTFLRNVRKQFTQTYDPTTQNTCLLSAKTGLQNETFGAVSFPVDKSVKLRTSLVDLSLQYSLSLSLNKEVGYYYHLLICT